MTTTKKMLEDLKITDQNLHEMQIVTEDLQSILNLVKKQNAEEKTDLRKLKWNLRVIVSQCIELQEKTEYVLNNDLTPELPF